MREDKRLALTEHIVAARALSRLNAYRNWEGARLNNRIGNAGEYEEPVVPFETQKFWCPAFAFASCCAARDLFIGWNAKRLVTLESILVVRIKEFFLTR